MKKTILTFVIMNFFSSLFGQNKEPLKVEQNIDRYESTDEDTLMNVAIEKANNTIDYFIESLQNPKPCQRGFNLKIRITEGEIIEHIWLGDIELINSKPAFGIIENDPFDLKLVKYGMRYPIDSNLISDWMIIEDGRLIGGYTNRCFMERLSEAEKNTFVESLSYKIDDGVDYFKHDFSTPEGAILCLEDAYIAKDMEKAIECVNFEMEAYEMLIPLFKDKPSLIDSTLIKSEAELLKTLFSHDMKLNIFPSFENVERTFPSKENISDNIVIVTEICHYADGSKSKQRIKVGRQDGLWKFMSPID